MTAMELLLRVTHIERKLMNARSKEERYKDAVTHITASVGGQHVSHTRNVTSLQDAIIRYMEASDDANRLEIERNTVVDEIDGIIDQLSNQDSKVILRRFYIDHIPLDQIASQIHLAQSYMYQRKRMAVSELQELLSKSSF